LPDVAHDDIHISVVIEIADDQGAAGLLDCESLS
jgi:hypothetical protein